MNLQQVLYSANRRVKKDYQMVIPFVIRDYEGL